MGRFLKGALAVGVVAGVTMTATAAIAGTGIGGIFNLGQNNPVGATTQLSGTTAGPELRVNNSSTASGASALSLQTPTSQPPMRVSSSTLVDKLNADRVDGLSPSQLSRIGSGAVENGISSPTVSLFDSLQIRVPTAGYVEVTGTFYAEATDPDGCNACQVHARLAEAGGQVGRAVITRLHPTLSKPDDAAITTTWVFSAGPGVHTYQLQIGTPDGEVDNPSFFNSVLTARFSPYGREGTQPN